MMVNKNRVMSVAGAIGCCVAVVAIVLFLSLRPETYEVHQYKNERTGRIESYALHIEPAENGQKPILLVYLHGVGHNYLEPFIWPKKPTFFHTVHREYPRMSCVSPDYCGVSSWGSGESFNNITGTIRGVLKTLPNAELLLAGTSMGGTSILTYAAVAPPDIGDRVRGILAVYPADDLVKLYQETKAYQMTFSLQKAFDGPPQSKMNDYLTTSLVTHLGSFPKSLPVVVVCSTDDTIIPTSRQKAAIEALVSLGVKVHKITLQGNHAPVCGSAVTEGLHFLMDDGHNSQTAQRLHSGSNI